MVNSAVDRPWAQYFCCITVGNRAFVRKHPVATKRALRAILKASDLCALEPERAARSVWTRDTLGRLHLRAPDDAEVPYGKWREYDPEDTVRFYALRHEEVHGPVEPAEAHRPGTDWRFLTELKKELKQ